MVGYTGLDQVRDPATKAALRYLWDAFRSIASQETSMALGLAELVSIRSNLQRGGSTELNVSGLSGKLLEQQPSAVVYFAVFSQTADQAGTGYYEWDAEITNTAPHVYKREGASNVRIAVKQSGSYLVIASVGANGSAGGFARAYLMHNSDNVGRAFFNSTTNVQLPLVSVLQMKAGDFVRISLQTGATRTGDDTGRSIIVLVRLQ